MRCPASDCAAAMPHQRPLMTGEQDEIGEPWVTEARICMYCGCVHSFDCQGAPRIHGFYGNPLRGPGWRPSA